MNFLFVNTHTRTTWMKQETRSVACAVLLESSGQVQWFEAKSWDLHIEENSQTLRTTPWRVMMHNHTNGGRDSLLVRAPDLWSKGCEFESRQERREHFLLQSELCVLTLIRCPFQPRVTAVARKRPRSFCQKCRWQVTPKHAYVLDPTKSEWADYAFQA